MAIPDAARWAPFETSRLAHTQVGDVVARSSAARRLRIPDSLVPTTSAWG